LISGFGLSAANVYAPPSVSLGSFTVGGALTGVVAIDASAYAGAGTLKGTVTGFSGTSVTATITAQARTLTGVVATGRTFTATIAANGVVTFVPGVSGDLCLKVTGVSLPAGMTAGTLALSSAVPSGRAYPTV
jgi:hypothetical protein